MANSFPPTDVMCHRSGFTVSCFNGVVQHKCQLWSRMDGVDPKTGAATESHGCIDIMTPLMQFETNKKLNELGAAVESFRNYAVTMAQQQLMQTVEKTVRELGPATVVKALEVKEDAKD